MRSIASLIFLMAGLLLLLPACQQEFLPTAGPKPLEVDDLQYDGEGWYCANCHKLGNIIALTEMDLFIAEQQSVFWLAIRNNEWKVQQVFNFGMTVQNITVQDQTLCIGLLDRNSAGIVKIYEKISGSWQQIQELSRGLERDVFGGAIALNGDHLMIGALAPPQDASLSDTSPASYVGTIYFFQRQAGTWKLIDNFQTIDSKNGNQIGNEVAISGRYAFAGSPLIDGLYLYTFKDDHWHFLKRIKDPDFGRIVRLSVSNNRLMIKSYYVNVQPIHIYDLLNGDLVAENEIFIASFDETPGTQSASHGPVIQLGDDFAVLAQLNAIDGVWGYLVVLEFVNGSWQERNRYQTPAGTGNFATAFAVNRDWVIVGDNYYNYWDGRVYVFRYE